jgi:hypothetical protein
MTDLVVLMHAGVCADSFRPLLEQPALCDRYSLISYHRTGYAGSGRLPGAMEPNVELDEHLPVKASPIELGRETFGGGDAVDCDRQLDILGDVGEPTPLVGAERRVVNEDRRRSSATGRATRRRRRHVDARRLRA